MSKFVSFFTRSCRTIQFLQKYYHTSRILDSEHDASLTNESLIVEQCDQVRMIGLNRPLKRNALNMELINALRVELKSLEEDKETVVGLLYGVGGNFCSGIDLEEVHVSSQKLPLVDEYCSKPIVACVSGYAVAEGFDLAMACDIRVMEDQAILGVFNRRFGVPMSVSAINRLVACTGLALALDLILTGRPITTEEAFLKGIVTRHVPCGASRGDGLTAARQLIKFPQAAMLADRAAVYQHILLSQDLLKVLNHERISNLAAAQEEVNANSKKFFEGVGRSGSFKNLFVDQDRPLWMDSQQIGRIQPEGKEYKNNH